MSFRQLPGRLLPALDEWVFNRDRDRIVRDLLSDPRYAAAAVTAEMPAQSHVVVVPQASGSDARWQLAQGTFMFEIAQTAREYLGEKRVSVFEVRPEEQPQAWHPRLITFLAQAGATHLVAQIEADPYRTAERWTWDAFWTQAAQAWAGVLLGVTYDSSWRWLAAQSRRLARIDERFVLIDICMPMDGVLVAARPEVGPVNMPVSRLSLEFIEKVTARTPRDIDVSFIGALYPDRITALHALADLGIDVVVNPHHRAPANLAGEVRHSATYTDYMRALARSRITLNFSKASAGPFQQLKTRILEATLMGAVVVTDDRDRTERFWMKGKEFERFDSLEELGATIRRLLNDTAELQVMSSQARARALDLHSSGLWRSVDRTLDQRGLPLVGGRASTSTRASSAYTPQNEG